MSEIKQTNGSDLAGIAKKISDKEESTVKAIAEKMRALMQSTEALRSSFNAKKNAFLEKITLENEKRIAEENAKKAAEAKAKALAAEEAKKGEQEANAVEQSVPPIVAPTVKKEEESKPSVGEMPRYTVEDFIGSAAKQKKNNYTVVKTFEKPQPIKQDDSFGKKKTPVQSDKNAKKKAFEEKKPLNKKEKIK